MGVYEYQGGSGLFGDSDNDGDVDMTDFVAFAANWLVRVE